MVFLFHGLGQKNKYSKLQQGDGVILNGQSADIDDRASAGCSKRSSRFELCIVLNDQR